MIRHVMLAEPMVEDFQRAFSDVTDPAEVKQLAQSFAFENCSIRADLQEVLLDFLPARVRA